MMSATTVKFLGNDVSAERNSRRKFITRSDCYGLCRDPVLIEAVKSNDPAVNKLMICFGFSRSNF